MSKGYYAVQTIVFHNIEDRKKYQEQNPSVLNIGRKEAYKFHKEMNHPFFCGSCGQYHLPGRVYKEKDDAE